MATQSSLLAWRIPWTEEPGLQAVGPQRVRHDRATNTLSASTQGKASGPTFAQPYLHKTVTYHPRDSIWASLVSQTAKNLPAMWETRFDAWVRKIPWRRKCLPTPVFLPGESHGQKNLAGYSPWGHKELDTTEQLTLFLYRSLQSIEHCSLCYIQQVLTSHLFCIQQCVYVNPSLSIQPSLLLSPGNHKFAFYICDSVYFFFVNKFIFTHF